MTIVRNIQMKPETDPHTVIDIPDIESLFRSAEIARTIKIFGENSAYDERIHYLEDDLKEAHRAKLAKSQQISNIAALDFQTTLKGVVAGLSKGVEINEGLLDPAQARQLLLIAGLIQDPLFPKIVSPLQEEIKWLITELEKQFPAVKTQFSEIKNTFATPLGSH